MHLKILCIGRIKKSYWQEAAQTYLHRLQKFYTLQVHELKDGPAHLQPAQRIQAEVSMLTAKASGQDRLICLDQRGKSLRSRDLAVKLEDWVQTPGGYPCFILGGAYGLGQELLAKSDFVLSFGPMTLPHELARIVLLEQLYRATTIIKNHPYHH